MKRKQKIRQLMSYNCNRTTVYNKAERKVLKMVTVVMMMMMIKMIRRRIE